MVDCKHILLHLDDKPQGEDEENESEQQIAFADRVLLNKIDLVDEKELANIEFRVTQVNAHVKCIKTVKGKCDVNELINIGGFDLDKVLVMDPNFINEGNKKKDKKHDHDCKGDDCDHDDHHKEEKNGHHEKHGDHEKHGEHGKDHHDKHSTEASKHGHHGHKHKHMSVVSSVGIVWEGMCSLEKMQKMLDFFIKTMGKDLFRYKGVMSIAGIDQKWVFQGVHEIFDGEYTSEWLPGERRVNKLVFIGRKLDRKLVNEKFEETK